MTACLNSLAAGRDAPIVIAGVRTGGGRLLAANVILFGGDAAYYWLSGYDARDPQAGDANQLCRVRTLELAAGRATTFDWVGANTPGVCDYKRTLGPTLIPYYRISLGSARAALKPTGALDRVRGWLCGASPNRNSL
jgi:hypothetical protein